MEVMMNDRAAVISRNPRDGSIIGQVPADTGHSVRDKVARANAASAAWAAASARERITRLRKVRDELARRGDDLAAVISQETGKPLAEAYFAEVVPNKDIFNFHARAVPKLLKPQRVRLDPINYPAKNATIVQVPRGTIGLITPWNYPAAIPLRSLVPALLAGNTVVFKPSSATALTGQLLADAFQQHLPPGVLEVIQGPGPLGELLLDERIDLLIFTGSVEVGRRLAARAGERLIPVALELGGKDPAIVLEDADLDRAAAGLAWGAFTNCGQNCAAIERVIVVGAIYDQLMIKLKQEISKLTGWTSEADGDVGLLTTAGQFQTVKQHLVDAQNRGAELVAGGAELDGKSFAPTLLGNPLPEMLALTEETFGPLLPVLRVDSVEQAIALANQSAYGLTASIWTRDFELARSLFPRLQCGVVTVNNHSFSAAIPAAPWTGVKSTGFGCTNSIHAVREMLRPRLYLEDRAKYARELWWYPYGQTAIDIARAINRLYSPGMFGRLLAIPRLVRAMLKRKAALK